VQPLTELDADMREAFADPAFWARYHAILRDYVGRPSPLFQAQKFSAEAGRGQIVGVTGDAGLGKSRLFHEFKLLSAGGYLILEAYSVSHGKASPYLPLIELLKGYFHIQPQDDERSRRPQDDDDDPLHAVGALGLCCYHARGRTP